MSIPRWAEQLSHPGTSRDRSRADDRKAVADLDTEYQAAVKNNDARRWIDSWPMTLSSSPVSGKS